MVTRETEPFGICPACGQTVGCKEDAVWTCPCDLSRENAYWMDSPITEEECEKDGNYSLCPDRHPNWVCGLEDVPLHRACYANGTW